MASENQRFITVIGAAEHNLKNINVEIPRNALTVITGISGSGKSSLAFDTIYAEGQRRYVESLSSYARQFLDQLQKPHVEQITGLSPAISIEQKSVSRNPRSTVGTVTELYDYLRVLYANLGEPHCPQCGKPIARQTVQQIVDQIESWPEGTRILILAPVIRGRKGEHRQILDQAARDGFVRARVDGKMVALEEPPKLNKRLKHTIEIVIDRLVVGPAIQSRLTDSVEIALRKAEGLLVVEEAEGEGKGARGAAPRRQMFSEQFACPDCQISLDELTPRSFSFNSPYGACPKCNGLGTLPEIDERLVVPDPSLSVEEGAIVPWAGVFGRGEIGERSETSWTQYMVRAVARHFGIDLTKPFGRLPKKHQQILLYGAGNEKFRVRGETKAAGRWERTIKFEGVIPNLDRRLRETDSDMIREQILAYFADTPCPECGGGRLRRESLGVTIRNKNLSQYCELSVEQARRFLEGIKWTAYERQVGGQVVKEILDRLRFMENVGLGYLTLDRRSATLAGGEAQRIRLATQIGSQLTGVLYVLDEPSIGLHQRDNHRLLDTLKALRDLGNTVIVVEHDEATIRSADYVVDLGPGAGRLGGEIVAVGPPKAIELAPRSITGRYLAGCEAIRIPDRRRPRNQKSLVVVGAGEHNLKAIDVAIPLGLLTCITGVSGSGKSTLVNDILYNALAQRFYHSTARPGRHKRIDGVEHLDKVISVDQSPIGRTPRSNPATYTGVFSPIRDLFAQLPESRLRGYRPGRFSFNVKGGRCEACEGDGVIKIEMHFLPDVYVECEACKGRRFNRETLEVTYRGRNIADVLEMPAEEALEFFANIPAIRQKLQTLYDVGLGYIHLGQQATTLSGGEAQRIKLAKELSKRNTGRTLYILDEPTTGLHFDDIKKLLDVLNRLVDAGSTVVVIEHNFEVIKTADWIIDLGPEGGDAGGYIVAEGTPEEIARHPKSYTGVFLRKIVQ